MDKNTEAVNIKLEWGKKCVCQHALWGGGVGSSYKSDRGCGCVVTYINISDKKVGGSA